MSNNNMFESMVYGFPLGRCAVPPLSAPTDLFSEAATVNRTGHTAAGRLQYDPTRPWKAEDVCPAGPDALRHRLRELLWDISDRVFVGVVEQWDRSFTLMGDVLGLDDMRYCRKNSVPNAPKQAALRVSLLEMIRERNFLDAELYAAASEVFEARARCYGRHAGTPSETAADALAEATRSFTANNTAFEATNCGHKGTGKVIPDKLLDPDYRDDCGKKWHEHNDNHAEQKSPTDTDE